jgi:thioredoxin
LAGDDTNAGSRHPITDHRLCIQTICKTMSDFNTDVVETSRRKPVLVDFYAPWCGPCHVLTPVIDKLAREANGAWRLVKINVDAHPELAQRYNIRGIPAVKMFVDGEVAAEFAGALPEPRLRQWLEENLPAMREA